jgi:hypothetical protein
MSSDSKTALHPVSLTDSQWRTIRVLLRAQAYANMRASIHDKSVGDGQLLLDIAHAITNQRGFGH